MQITEYEPETGRLLGIWTFGDDMADSFSFPHIKGAHDTNTKYVDIRRDKSKAVLRPRQTTKQNKTEIEAGGVDLLVLLDLPKPCKVWIGEQDFFVEDGVLEYGSHIPCNHTIRVEAFPYLDWEGTVTVVCG